jgi:hypothetical protein
MLDDITDGFSGDDETREASSAKPESGPRMMTSAVKPTTAAGTSTAVNAGMRLIAMVGQALGVIEKQSKEGLGAIFVAASATLAPEDYKLIGTLFRTSTVMLPPRPRLISWSVVQ